MPSFDAFVVASSRNEANEKANLYLVGYNGAVNNYEVGDVVHIPGRVIL